MNIGYVRVFKEQDLDLQMQAFKKPVARGCFRGSLERYGLPQMGKRMLRERPGGPSHARPWSYSNSEYRADGQRPVVGLQTPLRRYHHRHRAKGGYPLDAADSQPACISIS